MLMDHSTDMIFESRGRAHRVHLAELGGAGTAPAHFIGRWARTIHPGDRHVSPHTLNRLDRPLHRAIPDQEWRRLELAGNDRRARVDPDGRPRAGRSFAIDERVRAETALAASSQIPEPGRGARDVVYTHDLQATSPPPM
jgi:hypothetical protein